ncbi:CPBP family intramembrane glutamic endopeptidase [Pantoea sp.]|uniref:CPBP family intramembrane glutamic endopeptidase n=1 Tax=Pantoea sp. TaxID=69393 RepID=UPI0028B08086|nr:CPBP family intramembrane glutamic endopeptidase [Pantoea sp.]
MWYFLAASLLSLRVNKIISGFLLAVAVGLGYVNQVIDYHALFLLLVVVGNYLLMISVGEKSRKIKEGLSCINLLIALALALHLIPGFDNPKVLDSVIAGSQSAPFTMYYNFDKALIPFVLLISMKTLFVAKPAKQSGVLGWALLIVSVPALLLLGVALGGLRIEPHLPAWFAQFALANLFFVSLAEEALFRGYVQQRLTQFISPVLALLITSALFGVMHYAGGWLLVFFAGLSGIIYGLAWMWSGRLWVAVMFHFGLNCIHLLFFTYPFYSRH